MSPGKQWQVAALVGAILVPSLVLIGVTRKTIQQNRELAVKRQGDERRREQGQVARELLANLETLKGTALAAQAAPADTRIALVADLVAGRIVAPWESDPGGRRAKQVTAAATGQQARALLSLPADLVDEEGVPVVVREAAVLAVSRPDRAAVRRALDRALDARRWHSPAATLAFSDVADQLQAVAPEEDREWLARLRSRIAAAITLHVQVNALQEDAAVQAALQAQASGGKVRWTFHAGAEPWLLSAGRKPDGQAAAVAVAAREAFRPFEAAGCRLGPPTELGGELLGDPFPGLMIELPPREVPESAPLPLQSGLYYLALVVLIGAASFGAVVLWRSLQREMQLAETRAQFVSSVSHELKTPLTAIRMFAETLQMRDPDDAQVRNEYLDTIVNECGRLSRLVDDVLLFSRIEQGKKVYRFQPVDLRGVIGSVARTLSYPLAQHQFALRQHLDAGVPPANADPDAIEQAVMNLVTNAMKYSGDRKEIDIRFSREGGEAAIAVTDYGVGIAPEEQGRIFEKYYRVPAPQNQAVPGTGLGLTLVAQIAKAHGGRVEVRSAPGQGSTFTLRLPIGDSS